MKLIDIMVLTKKRNKEGWIYLELACKTSKDPSWDKKLQTDTEDYSNCLNIEKLLKVTLMDFKAKHCKD